MLVVTDADNTLWDTNAVYARAQLALLSRIEGRLRTRASTGDRLAFVRDVDQAVASAHAGDLRYPPMLLARGLVAALGSAHGIDPHAVDCEQEAAEFLNDLRAVPELRPGVFEGLRLLTEIGATIVIATESAGARCAELVRHRDLSVFAKDVVAERKSPELFRRIREKWSQGADQPFVIGDQIDRDIEFGKAAGFTTLFVPSGFVPYWTLTNATKPDYVFERFDECARTIAATRRGELGVDLHRRTV
jgi:putative hydrolase of the HAD superfamily